MTKLQEELYFRIKTAKSDLSLSRSNMLKGNTDSIFSFGYCSFLQGYIYALEDFYRFLKDENKSAHNPDEKKDLK